jgi:hypothetical protein
MYRDYRTVCRNVFRDGYCAGICSDVGRVMAEVLTVIFVFMILLGLAGLTSNGVGEPTTELPDMEDEDER